MAVPNSGDRYSSIAPEKHGFTGLARSVVEPTLQMLLPRHRQVMVMVRIPYGETKPVKLWDIGFGCPDPP